MSNIPLSEFKSEIFPVTLYQNVYRARGGELVYYQQYHESLESAKKTFRIQENGDEPLYTLEIKLMAHI